MALAIVTNVLYTVFLATLLSAILPCLLKSAGTVFNSTTSKSSTLVFKVFKVFGRTANLSASVFKLARSDFPDNLDLLTTVAFLNKLLLHNLINLV